MLRPPPALPRSTSRQLPLPLAVPAAARSPLLPIPAADVTADQVWSSLSPALQAELRRAAGRILQEVVRDAGQC
jgi:hypothetical protein